VRLEKEIISNTQLGFINSIISQLKSTETKIKEDKQDFICGIINGICNNLDSKGKEDALNFIFKYFDSDIDKSAKPNTLNKYVQNGKWLEFKTASIKNAEVNKVFSREVMVGLPTQLKALTQIQQLVAVGENVILVGPSGSGKQMLLQSILSANKGACIVNVDCNADTTAFDLIRKLQSKSIAINNVNGKLWRPKSGNKFIFNIKNLNIIDPDNYDTIGLVEFLLQLLTYKGF